MNKKKLMQLRSYASQEYTVEEIAARLGMNESDVECAIIQMGYRLKYASGKAGRQRITKADEGQIHSADCGDTAEDKLYSMLKEGFKSGCRLTLTYATACRPVTERRAFRDVKTLLKKIRDEYPECQYIYVIEIKDFEVMAIHIDLSMTESIEKLNLLWKYGFAGSYMTLKGFDKEALKCHAEFLRSKGRVVYSRGLEKINNQNNEKSVGKPRKLTDDERSTIITLYKSGSSIGSICRTVKRSYTAVRAVIYRWEGLKT
ncbi:MAG: hypothetical protein J5994_10695 [Ruminococcus sp.]|nr:hypothetical protein [Ruminococcus sp.]